MAGHSRIPAAVLVLTITALCSLTVGAPAQTQTVPDLAELARGEHIARFVCATCHVVAEHQEFAPLLSKPAASFFDIANRPGMSTESIVQFIGTTHWDPDKLAMTMPALMASPDQAQAVARYILSLKKH